MPSLDDTFQELMEHMRHPEALNPARSDPFFYFVHGPEETLEIKKKLVIWQSVLRNQGWAVERISLAHLLWKVIDETGRWNQWLDLEPDFSMDELNESIRDALRSTNGLVEALARSVELDRPRTVLLLTDAAVLHPYFRSRILESSLHDRVRTPTVLFYPGRRSGQYGLHFLNFYPPDGNYRSTLVGGLL